jgi:ABC-2 type transport system permease protein
VSVDTVNLGTAGERAPLSARAPLQPPHESRLARVRWGAKDALVITRRGIQRIRHEPMQLSDVTFQPVIFVLLFAYVFGSAISIGHGGYREFLVAGLFGLIIAQTAPGTTVGLSTDMNTGVIDRFRSLPMSRSAVLVGRTLSDLCTNFVAVVVVAVTGLLVGWTIHTSVLDAVAAVALLLLFAMGMTWAGACLGMVMKNVEAAQATAFMVFLPLTFISNAFVPTGGMPSWLQPIANWNPISAVAAACRELFGNPNPSAHIDAWPMQHPVLAAVLWSLVFIAVFAPLGVRLYRRRAMV